MTLYLARPRQSWQPTGQGQYISFPEPFVSCIPLKAAPEPSGQRPVEKDVLQPRPYVNGTLGPGRNVPGSSSAHGVLERCGRAVRGGVAAG